MIEDIELKGKSGWADLNRRPPRPKRGALPTALHPEPLEYNLKQYEPSRNPHLPWLRTHRFAPRLFAWSSPWR
jgi:hypothetical protein